MSHLKLETLARLVDEPPNPDEAAHLAACEVCAGELDALREQTEGLAALPDPTPPAESWQEITQRLDRPDGSVFHSRSMRVMTRIAAALVIFVAGAAVGSTFGEARALASTAYEDDRWAAAGIEEDEFFALDDVGGDPLTRIVALEAIVASTRAALAEAPADPVINGYHLSARQARDETIRRLGSAVEADDRADGWF